MKSLKKIMALVIAMVMVLGMSTMAMADPTTYKITNNNTGHTYEVYQIFTGNYDTTSGQLQNLKYGTHAKGTTGAAVSADDMKTLSEYTDAGDTQALDQQDITFISQFVNLTPASTDTIAAGEYKSFVPGYYLIKDVDGSLAGTDEKYTLYLISILHDDITITPKTGTTTSEKKVDDINDSTGVAESLQDSADYEIGDYVPFHLKAHTADNVNAYKKYHLTFTDTLESGKFDDITTPVIKIAGTEISEVVSDDYTVSYEYLTEKSPSGFAVKVTFVPKGTATLLPAALNGIDVTVDFTAKLGTGAIIGNPGNVNTFQLKYSNNPNSTDDQDEGTNPEDTVIVFTYDLVVNKQDEDKAALNGATFALYKKYTADQLTATGKQAVEEIKYDNNNKTYSIPDGTKYVQVGSNIDGASKSTFTFNGIDDGEYLLVEVKAPTGYNCLEPKTFTVSATHAAKADGLDKTTKKDNGNNILTAVSGTGQITLAQHTKTDGNIDGVSTDIINNSGAILPSTGGIGTTIFYVIGAILVLGAGILLVSKRRMSAN